MSANEVKTKESNRMKKFPAICLAALFAATSLFAGEVADLSRDGVEVKVAAEPETVDVGRDFFVTVTATFPAGADAGLPDLQDRFRGFRVAEDFAEEPIKDASGATTVVSRWRLVPEPAAGKYTLRPFVVGSFCTAPVVFAPPAARESVTGGMEIDPRKDLPPLSWKLVGVIAAALAVLAGLIALVWWTVRKVCEMVRVHKMSPIQRAYWELDRLLSRELPARGLYKDFYVELTMVVRRYVARKYGIKAPNMTTEEFFAEISGGDRLPRERVQSLREFLSSADLVKFAGVEATPAMAADATTSARNYLSTDSSDNKSARL